MTQHKIEVSKKIAEILSGLMAEHFNKECSFTFIVKHQKDPQPVLFITDDPATTKAAAEATEAQAGSMN